MDPTKSTSWWNPQPPPPPTDSSERTPRGMFGLPHLSGGFLPSNSTIPSGLQRRRSSLFLNEFPPSSTVTFPHPPVHHSTNNNKQADFGRYPPNTNLGSVSFGVHNNNHPSQLAPTTTIGVDFTGTNHHRGERQQQQQLLMNQRHSGLFLSSMSPLMMELSTIHNMRQTQQQQQPQSEHRNHGIPTMPDRMPLFSLNNSLPGANMGSHSAPHVPVMPFGPFLPFPTPELLHLQQHSGSSQSREPSSPVSTSPRASRGVPDTSRGPTNGLYLNHQGVPVSPLQVTRKTPSAVDANHANPITSSPSSAAASSTLTISRGGVPPVAFSSPMPAGKASIALAMLRHRSRSSSASVLDLAETSDGSRSASLSSTPTGELFGGHRRVSSTSSTDLESSPGPRKNSSNNKRTRAFRRNLEAQMIQEPFGTEVVQKDGGSASEDDGDHDSNVEEKDFENSDGAGPKKKGNKSPRVSDELRKRPLPDSPSLTSSAQPPLPSTSSTITAANGQHLPAVAPSPSLQRSSSMQSIVVSDDGTYAGQQSGLGGERRLNITFERFGVIRSGQKQTFGKSGWGIPDGLAGRHTMYAQQWRVEVLHGEVLGTVVITFKVKNLSPINNISSEKEIVVTESPEQAALRQSRGNTICNIVLRKALDARAAELEALIQEGGKSPVQIAHLKSLIRELNPKQCTEGLLFFGLRHETVQLRALESPVAATANAGDQQMEISVGENAIKRAISASY